MKKFFKYLSIFATASMMMTMASCSNDTFDEIQPDSSANLATRSAADESRFLVPKLDVTLQANSAGVLVLNEGNMTSQNGFLNYLDKDRYYNTVVGGSRLGNVCQDLYINNNYIYVVAQNTKPSDSGTGIIFKLDASNFETLATYPTKFSSTVYANNPTHIAVYNDNTIYVRGSGIKYDGTGSGNGVCRYNPSTNIAQRLEDGGQAASAAPMVIAGNYLYVSYSDKVRVYEANTTKVEAVATIDASTKGVVKSTDGRYVYAYSANGIYVVDTQAAPLSATFKPVSLSLQSWVNSAVMSYYNGRLYFVSGGYIAYCDPVAGTVTTTSVSILDEIKNLTGLNVGNQIYNGLAVDPATGYLYVATTSWGAAYKTTTALNVFQIDGDFVDYVTSVIGYERFTAGIFFPQNFGATVGMASYQTKIVADPTDDK